jgi:heme/copper-type cytochrome/quinol oxidase subunit 4
MLFRKMILTLLTATIAFSLVNNDLFGSVSLFAYFFYCIVANIASLALFLHLFFKRPTKYNLPNYLIFIVLLGIYIAIHGLVNNNFNLTHYY